MAGGKRPFDVPDVVIPDLDLRPASARPPATRTGPGAPAPAPDSPAASRRPPTVDAGPLDFDSGVSSDGGMGPMAGAGAPMPVSGLDLDGVPSSQRSMPAASRAGSSPGPASGARRGSAPGPRGVDLELDYRRGAPRESMYEEEAPSVLMRIVGWFLSLAGFGGAAAACFMYLHRVGGRHPMGLLPHAWDGTSMTTSAIVSVVMFILAMSFGIWGLFTRPRTIGFIGAGGLMLLESLGMVTVALASSGEAGAPPDGALLVPWLTPAFLVLIGLGVSSRGAVMWVRGGWRRRLATLPLGAIGGAIAFVGYEISRFA